MRTTAQESSFESITAIDLTAVQGGCGKKRHRCCCPPPPAPAPAPAPVAPAGPQVSTSVAINYQ
jgi:hypothetical protein